MLVAIIDYRGLVTPKPNN